MCSKRLNFGLRLIAVSFVLLVLVLAPVSAAWPFFFGEKTAPSPTQTDPVQNIEVEQKAEEIVLLKQQLKQLDGQLTESNKMLDTLSKNLQASGTRLNDTQATAQSLLNEIANLKSFLAASEDSRKALETDYDTLVAEYQLKADESNKYFQDATNAVAKYNALAGKHKNITTTVGTAAVMKEGKLGLDVTAGLNFGKIGVFGGATYMFGTDSFLKPADLMYKAGFAFTF